MLDKRESIAPLLFAPTAFMIAGVGAWAIGLGLKDGWLGWSLSWPAGLAAATMFLIINLLLEALGWRVGAPGAAQRGTMLTVMLVSKLSAALAVGAAIGLQLSRRPTSGVIRTVSHEMAGPI